MVEYNDHLQQIPLKSTASCDLQDQRRFPVRPRSSREEGLVMGKTREGRRHAQVSGLCASTAIHLDTPPLPESQHE